MELRNLRVFVEVVRQGGFSNAAKTVFATQSTVSKAVKQLEEEIGAPLLERLGHRVRLTDLGEAVYPRAVRLLADRADLLSELDELRGLKRGTLRLGLPPVASSSIFAPLLVRYRRLYPGIDVRLIEHGGDELMERVRSGDLDLAASLRPETDDLEWQDVKREPLVAVLAADHPLAQASSTDIAALRDVPFILFAEGFAINRLIGNACRRRGVEPVVAARSSQVDFLMELAAAGLGVAFLPRVLAEHRPHTRIRALLLTEPETEWRLTMIWRQGGYLPHAARAWLDMARQPSD
ncbi:LysR family transcriptional regulator [Nitrospirillum pindoramense]|uniref:DNA-binding transcriptional LysR family regulator n=1 Tax=Nitrospirillum amazonense TaxID=28077 RepID=A0A560GZS7_9PROT|nr:LysR family transcriptional regulator [Nitrospirillum amazonense]TWB39547.1 DNA-binding transcriptional LysR family regulator [Nitrospirillum amazonense]